MDMDGKTPVILKQIMTINPLSLRTVGRQLFSVSLYITRLISNYKNYNRFKRQLHVKLRSESNVNLQSANICRNICFTGIG